MLPCQAAAAARALHVRMYPRLSEVQLRRCSRWPCSHTLCHHAGGPCGRPAADQRGWRGDEPSAGERCCAPCLMRYELALPEGS